MSVEVLKQALEVLERCTAIYGAPEAIIAIKRELGYGCRRPLALGQWWVFCGETDMGQTPPALCTECGGDYKLKETK